MTGFYLVLIVMAGQAWLSWHQRRRRRLQREAWKREGLL